MKIEKILEFLEDYLYQKVNFATIKIIFESKDDEILFNKQDYAILMSELNTYLINKAVYRRKKFLMKYIGDYIFTFEKIKPFEYIIIKYKAIN